MYNKAIQITNKEEESGPTMDLINQMVQKINLSCFICSLTFNTTDRVPKIICRRQHTYCSCCVNLILRARPCRCPECRFKIFQENILINRALLAICQFLPQLNTEMQKLMGQNQHLKELNKKLLLYVKSIKENKDEQVNYRKQSLIVKKQTNEEKTYTTEYKGKNNQVRYKGGKKVINKTVEKESKVNPQEVSKPKYQKKDKFDVSLSIKQVKYQHTAFFFNPIIKSFKPQK